MADNREYGEVTETRRVYPAFEVGDCALFFIYPSQQHTSVDVRYIAYCVGTVTDRYWMPEYESWLYSVGGYDLIVEKTMLSADSVLIDALNKSGTGLGRSEAHGAGTIDYDGTVHDTGDTDNG